MFNVYGPRVRTTGVYGAVFGVFLAQKLHGKPLTVVGDGTQTRDFVYVTDVCAGVPAGRRVRRRPARCSTSAPAIPSRSTGWSSLIGGEVVHLPKRPGEPDCTWADISKIQRDARLGADGLLRGGRRDDARAHRALGGCPGLGSRLDRGGDQDMVSSS